MLEHLSGSSMNAYDNDIHSFYQRYVLGEEPVYCENVVKAMEFGKEYEIGLSQGMYKDYEESQINREDKTFESDFINKAQQIERFLKQFNIEVKHYDI